MSVEMRELQDSARQVITGAGLPAAEAEIWSQIVELGWLLVSVPEALGGLDAGFQGACTLHAELGRGLSAAPYLPAMLVIEALCASELEDCEGWLERALGGELLTASLAESTIALKGESLSGTATAVQSADTASHALIWTADHERVLLLDLEAAGVERIERPTWDTTRRLYDLRLSNIDLAEHTVLAGGEAAKALVCRLLVQRDFALAADAIGSADALLAQTVEYLQTRVQFRRPLGMFQALKHRCADLKAAIAAGDAMLFAALSEIGNDLAGKQAELRAKGAKLLATSTFARVAEEALQLHGGIGMADEHPCHLFLKRSLLSEQLGRVDSYPADVAAGLLGSA